VDVVVTVTVIAGAEDSRVMLQVHLSYDSSLSLSYRLKELWFVDVTRNEDVFSSSRDGHVACFALSS